MARIMALDIGGKRTGIAVTDPMQIIATGLTTIDADQLIVFLKEYLLRESVTLFVVGWPTNWNDSATHGTPLAARAIALLFIRWMNGLLPRWPRMPCLRWGLRKSSEEIKNLSMRSLPPSCYKNTCDRCKVRNFAV